MSKNDFYQAIFEQTSIGYSYNKVIYDEFGTPVDYQFVEMNQAYESMVGIRRAEWIGKTVGELYQSLNKESRTWEECNHFIFNKYQNKSDSINFNYLDKYYRVKIHSLKKDYIITVLTDISAEISEKEKLQTLFDSVPIQVWYLKDPKTYLSANKAHADFLGFSREDLVKMNINDMVNKESAKICIGGNQQVFQNKKEMITEEWLINPQGEQRLLRITKTPKLNKKGEIKFVICSAEDITTDHWNKIQKEVQANILNSTIDFTQELMINNNLEEALANGMAMLGSATKVDRVYYWENYTDKKTKQLSTQSKIEWYLDPHKPVSADAQFKDVRIEEYDEVIKPLSKNKPINFHTKDLNDGSPIKQFLNSQDIYSVLALPVFLKNQFTGFIGFDSYSQEKEWTEVEISLLSSFVLLYEKALEQAQLEEEIKQKKDNLFNFFNMIQDLLVVLDYEGKILDVNNTILNRLNYTREELLGESYLKLHGKDEITMSGKKFNELISNKGAYFKLNMLTKDGESFPIETTNSQGIWNGKPVIFAVGKDISELARSEDKFAKAFNNSGISMFISRFDDGTLLEVNDKFLDFFGYEKAEIIGETTSDLQIIRDYNSRDIFKEMIRLDGKISDLEIHFIDKNKDIRTGLTNIVPVTINNEKCLLTSIIDISDRVQNEKEIIDLSTRDHLTDVYNRRFIYEVLEEIIKDSVREKAIFSVAIIDIDNFKSINDQYGHLVGDDILVEFTKIIKDSLRVHDILGRYGGEEFIIILNHADIKNSTSVLERILNNVRKAKFIHAGDQIELTFSAGITSCKEFAKSELSIDKLIEVADKRMYQAKKEGKNKVICI